MNNDFPARGQPLHIDSKLGGGGGGGGLCNQIHRYFWWKETKTLKKSVAETGLITLPGCATEFIATSGGKSRKP